MQSVMTKTPGRSQCKMTLKETKKHDDQNTKERCQWRMTLKEIETGVFKIVRLSDFLTHCDQCIETPGRFTPVEVKHQKGLKSSTRVEMMGLMKQCSVSEETIRKQKQRLLTDVTKQLSLIFINQIQKQIPDMELTNLKTLKPVGGTISEESTVHIPLTAKGLKKTRSSQLEDDSELRPIFLLDCVNNGQFILLKIRHL